MEAEDILIVAGIGVAAWLLLRNSSTASNAIPTALNLSTAPSVSGGYQSLPSGYVDGIASPSSPALASSYLSPLPVPSAPPPYYGGTAGGAGSGGNPLGGTLRAGVSAGTGTTVSFRATPVGTLPPPTAITSKATRASTMVNFATGQVSYRAPVA